MKILKDHKIFSILVIIFISLLLMFFIQKIIINNTNYESENENYIMIPKTYDVNEYSVMNISDEQMSKIYLLDFRNLVYNDITSAYNLLDESYRNKKFGNLENFKNYINSIDFSSMVSKYSVKSEGKYDIYRVYDLNENLILFKITGVFQYRVYLDEDTVEI